MKLDAEPPPIPIHVDLVSEQMVVAAALSDIAVCDDLVAKVPADLFADATHAAVWSALIEARRKKLDPTPEMLQQLSGGAVGADWVIAIRGNYPQVTNVAQWVANLRWDHLRVEAVRGPLAELARALRDPTTDPAKLRALAHSVGVCFDGSTDRDYMRDPVLLAAEARAALDKRRQQPVWPYGIEGLDKFEDGSWRLIPGAAPTKVTLITGSSGSAKSTLTARIALEQARRKRRVLYGAWEMGETETLELMALMSLGWTRLKLAEAKVDDAELDEFHKRCELIGRWVRFFDMPYPHDGDRKRNANDRALDVFQRYVADGACEVVVCDLLERMLPDGRPEHERRALFRCQAIAKETRTHHIWVCQQRLKEIEQRASQRPTRSTILGTSAWVDVADTILGVHRAALWKQMADDTIQIDVLKQRFARWPLSVSFRWNGDTCELTDGKTVPYETPAVGKSSANTALGNFFNSGPRRGG